MYLNLKCGSLHYGYPDEGCLLSLCLFVCRPRWWSFPRSWCSGLDRWCPQQSHRLSFSPGLPPWSYWPVLLDLSSWCAGLPLVNAARLAACLGWPFLLRPCLWRLVIAGAHSLTSTWCFDFDPLSACFALASLQMCLVSDALASARQFENSYFEKL